MTTQIARRSFEFRSCGPLAARTPAQAVRTFAGAFQQACSCLTLARFNVESYRPLDLPAPYHAELQNGQSVPLGGSSLRMLAVLRYCIVPEAGVPGSWLVRLAAYDFELLDDDDREIIAYQWHPQGRGPVTWPHLHIGPAAGDLWRPVSRAHFPTGPIIVSEVIRLAIREFGVPPRRADWEAVLQRTRSALAAAQP